MPEPWYHAPPCEVPASADAGCVVSPLLQRSMDENCTANWPSEATALSALAQSSIVGKQIHNSPLNGIGTVCPCYLRRIYQRIHKH